MDISLIFTQRLVRQLLITVQDIGITFGSLMLLMANKEESETKETTGREGKLRVRKIEVRV